MQIRISIGAWGEGTSRPTLMCGWSEWDEDGEMVPGAAAFGGGNAPPHFVIATSRQHSLATSLVAYTHRNLHK